MRKFSGILFILALLMACNSDSKDPASQNRTVKEPNPKPAQIEEVPWAVEIDSATQKMKIVQNTKVVQTDLDVKNVTKVLVKKFPEIKIVWQKPVKDTAFVYIPNALYLSQSSGSMGADIFLAEVTYSYTQIPGIKFVHIDFEEGDHASPGTYKRSDFDFKK